MDYSKFTKEEVIVGIKNYEINFCSLPEAMRDDKDIVSIAIINNGPALEYVSERLKNDEDIVFMAFSHKTWSLEYASEELKDNRNFIIRIINKHEPSLIYASKRLQNDKELLEKLEKVNKSILSNFTKYWYVERMEFLASLRGKEEKEFMESSIVSSNINSKKIKF